MKRKIVDLLRVEYCVIETKEADETYVEFLPQLWLISDKKCGLKERDNTRFYFPLRLPQQTKDSFFKFLKHAKFVCMQPEPNENWEIKYGRILKLGLGNLEEALQSQKLFSDYFSSADGEKIVQDPVPKKVVRKKKKAAPQIECNTDESEHEGDQEVGSISNYNVHFVTDDAKHVFTLNEASGNIPVHLNQLIDESLFGTAGGNCADSLELMQNPVGNLTNNAFMAIDMPTTFNEAMQPAEEDIFGINQQTTAAGDNDDQHNSTHNDCCKGHQKILNKIEYVHKKNCKELSLLRQETSVNRKLLQQVLEILGQSKHQNEENHNEQTAEGQVELAQLDLAEIDSFNEKYKAIFPIKDCDFIIDFNKSMKDDKKFVDNLFVKLSQIKCEDETKTARKMLKELCHFRCLKDFTWLGTKKMKSFQNLHLIVELITKSLEVNFPGCQSLHILTKVVKQRTKSAKEAFNALTPEQQTDDSVEDNKKNDSTDCTDNADNNKADNGSTDLEEGGSQASG